MNVVEREIATYSFSKLDRLVRRDWGFFEETIARWKREGWNEDYTQFFFDESPYVEELISLAGIDLPLQPPFKEEIIESSEKYIYVRTPSGGIEAFPKGKKRLSGEIMPFYVKNPVENPKDWYDIIKPRLNPDTPERWITFHKRVNEVAEQIKRGEKLYQATIIGGYMYLRAMMGPEKTCIAFYDYPDMIHDMMKTWLKLIKACLLRIQSKFPLFKLLIGEDICYKSGLLISPAMVEEFLFPYYKDLINSLRNNQKDPLYVEIDTDGNLFQAVPLYMKIGVNAFRPFEVAAGNDVVKYAKEYPNLVISGGIDKRILAKNKEGIEKELKRIVPFMVKRGGYIPTCDHNIPSDVPYENYLFYRKLITCLDSWEIL